MAKPVIIDDGGSIRIREMQDDKAMDGLIGTNNVFASASSQQFFGGTSNNQCLLMVTSVADDGTFSQLPFNAGTGKYGQALSEGDMVVITTSDASPKTVTVTFNGGGFLSVALSVSASASERKRRRRYMMAVDMIQNVSVNGTTIFDAGTTTPSGTTVYFLDKQPHAAQIKHQTFL